MWVGEGVEDLGVVGRGVNMMKIHYMKSPKN